MKKNAQIHFYLETDLLNSLKKRANEDGFTISGFCRKKLREISQLDKIELLINSLDKKIEFILSTLTK